MFADSETRIEKLHDIIRDMQHERDLQETTMEHLEESRECDIKFFNNRIRTILEENDDLDMENSKLKKFTETQATQIEELSNLYEYQKQEQQMLVDEVTAQKNELQTALTSMTEQSNQQQQEIAQLKAQLKQLTSSNKRLKTQVQDFSKTILGVKRALRPKRS